MTRVTATQEDPSNPGAEDWRPTPTEHLASKERASFLASWGKDADDADDDVPAKPAKDVDPDDDDDDLADDDDADDEEEDAIAAKPGDAKTAPKSKAKAAPRADEPDEEEEPADDDSDLDEDDEKPAADPSVAKGLQKLQRQEQRMREQFERDRTQWQADVAKEREALQAEKTAAAEAKSKYERLAARAEADPAGVLEELGVTDFDYAAKQAFARSKAGAAPENKEAAARLRAEREHRTKLAELEKKIADRDKADEDARRQSEMRENVAAYLGGVVKSAATVTKATLTQKMIASDPDYARARFSEAAARLYKGGEFPSARAVIVEVEKAERAMLRRYGINPKSLSAPTAPEKSSKVDKTSKPANGKAKATTDDELRVPTKAELLAEDWNGPIVRTTRRS